MAGINSSRKIAPVNGVPQEKFEEGQAFLKKERETAKQMGMQRMEKVLVGQERPRGVSLRLTSPIKTPLLTKIVTPKTVTPVRAPAIATPLQVKVPRRRSFFDIGIRGTANEFVAKKTAAIETIAKRQDMAVGKFVAEKKKRVRSFFDVT